MDDLIYINEDGFHFPDYETILERLKERYRSIYGQDVYLEADSQDGAWIAVQALQAHYMCQLLQAVIFNQSPDTATGFGLSSNVKINGIQRRESGYSTVDILCVGEVGTEVRGGELEDNAGIKWLLPDFIIPASGEIAVTARAEEPGAIFAPSGSVNRILNPTRGWQSAINPAASTQGAPVQSDAELRLQQEFSTALPSKTIPVGMLGAIASLDGVQRLRAYVNDTGATDANGIPAHSMAFVVEGGDADEIARVIAIKKSIGAGTVGDITVSVVDASGVTDSINFYRQIPVQISVVLQARALPGYMASTGIEIMASVASFINAIQIGENVVNSHLACPATPKDEAKRRTIDIFNILLSRDGGQQTSDNIAIGFREVASCSVGDVEIVFPA